MRVLIACEYSGRVRQALRAMGHDALSADFEPAEDDSPYHYQGDCFDLIKDQQFDLLIAHPPCTYLSVSGLHWNTRGVLVGGRPRAELTEDALDFVRRLMGVPIPRIAIENPVSCISSRIRKPDQIIQPWQFGEDASKKTCLWLKGLPPLEVNINQVIPPRGWSKVMSAGDCIGTTKAVGGVLFGTREDPAPPMRWDNQTPNGQNKLGPSPDRWKIRSRTYQGIADAIAEQWG